MPALRLRSGRRLVEEAKAAVDDERGEPEGDLTIGALLDRIDGPAIDTGVGSLAALALLDTAYGLSMTTA